MLTIIYIIHTILYYIIIYRDVSDCYERLQRLDLHGKEDREIIRVLLECCAYEVNYNAYYPELNVTLCSQNRQYKTTTQYAFYDFIKTIESKDNNVTVITNRRIVNMARYLAHVMCSFDVPISMIKRADMSSLSSSMVLFFTTLFLGLFSAEVGVRLAIYYDINHWKLSVYLYMMCVCYSEYIIVYILYMLCDISLVTYSTLVYFYMLYTPLVTFTRIICSNAYVIDQRRDLREAVRSRGHYDRLPISTRQYRLLLTGTLYYTC